MQLVCFHWYGRYACDGAKGFTQNLILDSVNTLWFLTGNGNRMAHTVWRALLYCVINLKGGFISVFCNGSYSYLAV